MNDSISRQAAIDAECEVCQIAPKKERGHNCTYYVHGCKEIECLRALPSAQPEITDEQAIEHLRSTGWMQNHDREMYDMGLKEQLADDSGSYDSLLPSAQPEIIRCKECKYWTHIKRTDRYWCKTDDGLYDLNPSPDDFCSRAERRTDD